MKKILIWILVLTLIAVASAVATIAYFMYDTPLEENTMTVGNASIELVEYQRGADDTVVPFVNDKILIPSTIADGFEYDAVNYDPKKITADTPCVDWNSIKAGYKSPIWDSSNINDEVDKMVFVKNKGNTDVYVRVCFAFEAGNYVYKSHFDRMVHLNKNDKDWTWSWKNDVVEINGTRYFIAWATYNHVLPAGEYTNISLSQIALDVSAISDHARAFGEKYEVMAFAQGIQAHGFEGIGGLVNGAPVPSKDAPAALATGFDDTIPFKNVKEVNFVDLPTALHYLNGDTNAMGFVGSSQVPNTMVSSITFGLTADHSAKVVGREGVLVANKESRVDNKGNVTTPEADFTAYAYYVPTADGTQYDIYVLADDWEIYTPNNWDSSKRLFADMTGVKKIDTTNLNVSQTQNMGEWFNRCKALETIDVSDWDVSNVTDMEYLFNQCGKLANIDVSDWDVSNVTDMKFMFWGCPITTIDVADWDVSKVTDMGQMFNSCSNLTELDLNSWNTGNLEKMQGIFNGCGSLTTLNISKWDVRKVTNMSQAFYSCGSLTSVDIADWDVSSVTEMANMFYACGNLTELNLSSWTPINVTNMSNMFDGCKQLTSLDLSGWDTGNVKNMANMFGSCTALSSLKLPENVSAVTNMSKMFYQCRALTELDLSAWNIKKEDETKINMDQMFYMGTNSNVGELKTIYVGENWDPTYIGSSSNMFFNCTKLVGGNNTVYNASYVDKTYARVDTPSKDGNPAVPGYLTDIADKPANP